MRAAILSGLLLAPVLAEADEVFLRGGGHLTGQVIERGEDSIVVDVGVGTIGLPAALVERIVTGITPLAVYRERAARLEPTDLKGWLALAQWAREQDLPTQARKAFERALVLDPGNVTAHRALGHVQVDDRWMTEEESYRARGYVPFEGSWVTPEERRAILSERAAAVEAEARIREAEARARTAEAEARRAEAESRRAESAARGIPSGWAGVGFTPRLGTGFPGFHFGFHHPFHPFCPRFVHPFPILVPPPVVIVKTHRSTGFVMR